MRKITKYVVCILTLALLFLCIKAPKVNAAAYQNDPIELRGVWVATVSNIDISRQKGSNEKAINDYKADLTSILNRMETYGMNAMFFQVRPSNDAFYESKYNPYSEYFVGLGVNPGWDMLSWLCDECHKRGIQLHAWLNPYRVTGSTCYDFDKDTIEEINQVKLSLRGQVKATKQNVDNPVLIEDDEEFLQTVVAGAEDQLVLNPARQKSIDHISNTIRELVENFDLDGIHFDDYFYPSGGIEKGVENIDYQAYKDDGGILEIENWRRENVNKMVKAVSDIVKEYNKTSERYCAFGISPPDVWAPSSEKCHDSRGQDGGMNVACGSYSSYNDLYADTRKWVSEEWLDYILPQAYTRLENDYKEAVSWWANEVSKTSSVKLYVGTGLYQHTSSPSIWNDPDEIMNQFAYVLSIPKVRRNVSGYVMFSYQNLNSAQTPQKYANQKLMTAWRTGAVLPSYGKYTRTIEETSLPTTIFKISDKYCVTFDQLENANGYAIYAIPKDGGPDYNGSDMFLSKVFNQTYPNTKKSYTTTQFAINKYDFYIFIYDLNNNCVFKQLVDFASSTLENPGPDVTVNSNKTNCEKFGSIDIDVEASSMFELGLTVKLYVSHDGTGFTENYTLNPDSDGKYHYTYETFKDGIIDFEVRVSDGDKEVIKKLPTVKVGTAQDPDEPTNPTEPVDPLDPIDPSPEIEPKPGKKKGCKGAYVLLPFAVGATIILLRKRER